MKRRGLEHDAKVVAAQKRLDGAAQAQDDPTQRVLARDEVGNEASGQGKKGRGAPNRRVVIDRHVGRDGAQQDLGHITQGLAYQEEHKDLERALPALLAVGRDDKGKDDPPLVRDRDVVERRVGQRRDRVHDAGVDARGDAKDQHDGPGHGQVAKEALLGCNSSGHSLVLYGCQVWRPVICLQKDDAGEKPTPSQQLFDCSRCSHREGPCGPGATKCPERAGCRATRARQPSRPWPILFDIRFFCELLANRKQESCPKTGNTSRF